MLAVSAPVASHAPRLASPAEACLNLHCVCVPGPCMLQSLPANHICVLGVACVVATLQAPSFAATPPRPPTCARARGARGADGRHRGWPPSGRPLPRP